MSMNSEANREVKCSIVLSALMILTGIWAVILPPIASIAATVLVGWRMVFNGSSHLILGWLGERKETLLLGDAVSVLTAENKACLADPGEHRTPNRIAGKVC